MDDHKRMMSKIISSLKRFVEYDLIDIQRS